MERPSVLLAIEDDLLEHQAALAEAGFDVRLPDPGGEFSGDAPQYAILDCDLPVERVGSLYAKLHNGVSVPTLLLVGEETNMPSGFGTGHDEVALKPIPTDALVYRLQALMIRSGRALPVESGGWASNDSLSSAPIAGEGHVVSVFAPKGGVGKTTLALNMAVAIRLQTRSEVLLFDADVGVGNVTAAIEVPYKYGLSDLADSAPEEWTDAAFESAVAVHPESGLRVLAWGADPAESERVSVDLLLAAVRWARNHHSYVVIDNHPGYDDRTMSMLAVANEIFLIVTPEMGALRNSAQFLDLAREIGLAQAVRVIVNRANHGIKVEDMSRSLGLPIAATVVSNGPKAVIAANEGRPLVLKFEREKVADDIHTVARLVTQAAEPESGRPAKRWWIFGTRASQA